jgi:hypothetical protein
MVISIDFAKYMAEPMAAGRAVRLHDRRIGVIDSVRVNTLGGITTQRAYVVGVAKEFAVWVTRDEIARFYGVVEGVATSARDTAPIA